jgi:hypothetical protein
MGQTPHVTCAVVIMIVLGIDTATDAVSVALHDGNVVLASSEIRSDRQHAEALTSVTIKGFLIPTRSHSAFNKDRVPKSMLIWVR